MADNITAPATGAVLATDDVGGVHYPRTKLSVGGNGAAADVSESNPLPVSDGGIAPAHRWFAITPGTSNLGTVPDSLYVSVAGDLVVRGSDGVDATFAVHAGQILPIRPIQVRTGTTATVIGLVN